MLTAFSVRRTAITLIRLLLAGLLLITWAGLPRSGYSAPEATVRYVAPGGSDSGPCTTPTKPCEHIQAAIDKSASGDTVQIAPGTYIEQLTIRDRNLTLTGQSAASTFLDGGQLYQILSVSRESTPSMTVSLSGVTLRNGNGGAIFNDAYSYLTISNSNITNNTSSNGGGIFNNGFLKLINVTVSANTATSLEGGGIYNLGYIELSGVLLTNNEAPNGGGISNRNALTITASSIVSNIGNGGTDGGGGIYNVTPSSKLILLNSTLSGNTTRTNNFGGGAILNRGILTGTGTTIVGNTADNGGGIYNDTSGQAFFSYSSISGNTAVVSDGGGISNLGVLTMTQSALVYNASSTSQGGGLNNAGTARLTNVTISDNTALSSGGINNSGGTISLQFSTVSYNSSPALNNAGGSITAGNSILAQSAGNACGGTITSAGYNLDSGTSCGFSAANHDLSNTNPQLGPLQNNGGGTFTRAIAFSSPAVDSAYTVANVCATPVDQRGVGRPQPVPQPGQSSFCDRGAYEVVGYANINGLDIGVGQCGSSTVTINEKLAVGRMLAGVNLDTHNGSRAGLTIRLHSPGTPEVTLLVPAAGSGQNLDTMFDDSAPSTVPANVNLTPAPPYYDSTYKPSTPLSQFRGTGIKGTWRLQVCNAGAATVTLNRWVLVVPEFSAFKAYLPVTRRN